jgi:non-haem Fe2+, alpha-ketoglutarate-dependent halogenase
VRRYLRDQLPRVPCVRQRCVADRIPTAITLSFKDSPGFVSWHEDSTYWGLDPDEVITAWIAFTEVTPENGYMQVITGSHRVDQLPHVDTFHKDNLLSRGQEIAIDVDKSKAVGIALHAGEM